MNNIIDLKEKFKMKDITLIFAAAQNDIIGIKNRIPWRISKDMQRFRELTTPHPVIMGRLTYESIPEEYKPLEGRKNIVMSKTWKKENGIYIAKNIEEALELTENKNTFIIGGSQIYRLFLPLANKIELTRIHRDYQGDAHLPKINWKQWKEIGREDKKTIKGLKYSFLTYARI